MKAIQFIDTRSHYIIPVVLFIGSFLIYSYNLEGQPWHGDEINYLGWAGNYIHLIKNGDLVNSCLLSIDNCNLLYHIPAHGATYSPIRMLLIGIPLGIKNYDGGNFYDWSCYWFSCYDSHNGPTIEQMTTGRLFSPIFGSFTIVISFLIGKILFNRNVGIVASLLFLFYDLWIWYSRTIMTEVHYIFFSMLALLLLLYAFKTEKPKIIYLVLGAVTFGFALTSKLLAVEFSILFIGVILFKSFKKHSQTIDKKHILKIGLFVFLFFVIAGFSFVATAPGFYKNPLGQISLMKSDMDNYNRDVWFIGYPTIHGLDIVRVTSLFHFILFPSIIQYHIFEPYINMGFNYSWSNPPTYSSIALTIFFFIGLWYLIKNVIKSKDRSAEAILLVWFVSTFIFTLLMARDFRLERYLMPLLISVIFVAAYGFWNFIKGIPHNKLKISFTSYFIFSHSMTALFYWQKIYFSYGTFWFNPLSFGTLQQSIENPITFFVNVTFVGFFILMIMIRLRKRIEPLATA